jgi:hypothetical protein
MLTKLERIVMEAILNSEFQEGKDEDMVIGWDVWVDCLYDLPQDIGLTKSGAFGSLTKKGFINTNGECVHITQAGWDALKK